MYLDRLMTSTSCGRICGQLCLAALFQADEPEDRCLDGTADCQQAVILQEGSFLVAKASCDIIALLLGKDDAIEAFVEDVILTKVGQWSSTRYSLL